MVLTTPRRSPATYTQDSGTWTAQVTAVISRESKSSR
ncbi:hypothetical protein ACP70R_037090 [Stipagrostis hirtigluma subsp. patula]